MKWLDVERVMLPIAIKYEIKELEDKIKRIQSNCAHDYCDKNKACLICELELDQPEPEGDR